MASRPTPPLSGSRRSSAFQSSMSRQGTVSNPSSRSSSQPPPSGTAATCSVGSTGPMNPSNMPQPISHSKETISSRFYRPKKPYPSNAPRAQSAIKKVPLPERHQAISRRSPKKEKSMAEIAADLLPPGACNPYDSSTWHDSPINFPPEFLQEWEKIKPRLPSTRIQSPEAPSVAQRAYPCSPQQFYSSAGQRVPPFSFSPPRQQPGVPSPMSLRTFQEPVRRSPSPPTSGSRVEQLRSKLSSIQETDRHGVTTTERRLEATLITPGWQGMSPQEPNQSPQKRILSVTPPKRNLSMGFESTQAHLPSANYLGESRNVVNVENLLRRNMAQAASNIIPISETIVNTKSPSGLISDINQIDDFQIEMWNEPTCGQAASPCAYSPQEQAPNYSRAHERSPQVQTGNLLSLNPNISNEDISHQQNFLTIGPTESTVSIKSEAWSFDENNYDSNGLARGSPTTRSHLTSNDTCDEIDWESLQEESQIIDNQIKHGSPSRRLVPENFGSYSPIRGSPTSPRKFPQTPGPCNQRLSPTNKQADLHSQINDDMDWERMKQEAENIAFDIQNQPESPPRSEELICSDDVDEPQIYDDDKDDGVSRVVCDEEGVPLSTEQIEQIMRDYRMQKLIEEPSDLNDFTETEEALQIARQELAACLPCSQKGKQRGLDIRIRPSLIKMNQRYKAFRQKQASGFSPLNEIDEDIIEPEAIEPEVAAAIMHTEQHISFTESPKKMCEFLFPEDDEELSIMTSSIIQDTLSEIQGEENDQFQLPLKCSKYSSNGNDIQEAHSSKISTLTHDEILSESNFHETPIRYNRVQIRGSTKPSWFPGYYMVHPWIDDCIHLVDRPSTALHSAWEILKPSSYSANNSVLLDQSLH